MRLKSGTLGCLLVIFVALFLLSGFWPFSLFLLPVVALVGILPSIRHMGEANSFHQTSNRSATPLLILFAAIMKADGRIMRTELVYVSNALHKLFPTEQVPALIDELKEILHQNFSIGVACTQLVQIYSLQERISILYMLVGLAQADGYVDPQERYLLYQIAARLSLNPTYVDAFLRGHASYTYTTSGTESGYNDSHYSAPYNRSSATDPYKVLGIEPTASDTQVKAAYRKLVNMWHPDRFQSKSQEEIDRATEKFKEIQAAYEIIQNARGMK